MFHFNSWARHKYLDLFERLPWKVLIKHQEASFGSIRDIFLHTLMVNVSWFEEDFHLKSLKGLTDRLTGKNLRAFTSVARIRKVEGQIDSASLDFVDRLRVSDLGRKIWFNIKGCKFSLTWEDTLWHMVEEELQHRGEIIALLWAEDIEPPWANYMRWSYSSAKTRPKDSYFFSPSASRQGDGGYVHPPPKSPKESAQRFVPPTD
jgi:uncharacterized damage-inducible protein DinB